MTNVAKGPHRILATIANRETDEEVLRVETEFDNPGGIEDMMDLEIHVVALVIPAPGVYNVGMMMDGDMLTNRWLKVERQGAETR